MTNASITLFTDMVETVLQETSFVPSIAKGLYGSGQIVRGGAVEVLGTEDVTIGQYTGQMTHQALAGTNQKVQISHAPYYSVKLDGVKDLATAPANLKSFVVQKAGKGLALDLDTEFVKLASKAKVTVTADQSKVDNGFTGLVTAFDLANVGLNDRAVILDPMTCNTLISLQAHKLQVEKSANYLYEGYIGLYYGIQVFKSNKIGKTGDIHNCIGVDTSSVILPKNYEETREAKGVDFFGVAVQGIVSYGLDIIETETGKSNRIIAFDVDSTK